MENQDILVRRYYDAIRCGWEDNPHGPRCWGRVSKYGRSQVRVGIIGWRWKSTVVLNFRVASVSSKTRLLLTPQTNEFERQQGVEGEQTSRVYITWNYHDILQRKGWQPRSKSAFVSWKDDAFELLIPQRITTLPSSSRTKVRLLAKTRRFWDKGGLIHGWEDGRGSHLIKETWWVEGTVVVIEEVGSAKGVAGSHSRRQPQGIKCLRRSNRIYSVRSTRDKRLIAVVSNSLTQ